LYGPNPLRRWLDSFLVTIMGLVIPWSCTLAMIDVYSVLVGCPLRVPGVMVIVVVGDCVRTTMRGPLQSSSASRHVNSVNKKCILKRFGWKFCRRCR
jgi:hypothetical protein